MKRFTYIFFGALIALVAWGYINHWFLNPWGIGCNPHPQEPEVIVDTWSKPLNEAGFKPATPEKPDHIPGEKQPPAGEVVLHGSGTVENSGETVEIIGVETPDGKKWLTGWVGDRQISFQHLDWWSETALHDDGSDMSLIACCAWVDDSPDFGAGIAWQPVNALGIDAGLSISADVNAHLTSAPDWFAAGGRLSYQIGPFSAGGTVGGRLGQDAGLHLQLDAGVEIAF